MLIKTFLPATFVLLPSAQALTPPPELLRDLRAAVESAVERNKAEAILLSGGLDTSIVAALASKQGLLRAYTIALEGAPSPDIEYADLMAEHLCLNHKLHIFV